MFLLLAAMMPTTTPDADLFTSQVRPILAAHCFKCHGPDDKTRKAKLRLDRRDDARPVLGQIASSEFLRRINSTDESELMPPPHAKNPLNAEQKQLLARWIEQGAPYVDHWAFIPPRRPAVPAIVDSHAMIRNPIDAFIVDRLKRDGLSPAEQADRFTLVRRVYLDLIGVPPTPAQADAFVADQRPDAYERLVRQLLADPRYGERWARRWLDLARYADTNGYEKDRVRSIWPYRDWVINALNADMPFDQFTIEQLAGDMLPNASESQRIATGFHRNTMLNEEGGIDPLEFRFHAMVDRVNTTATVWLGLTLGCAQCHTHKFDPILQREYYQMLALLNNADEPTIEVHRPDIEAKRHQIQTKIDTMLAELPDQAPADELAKWLGEQRAQTVPWRVVRPDSLSSNLPLLTVQADDSIFASGDQTKSDTYHLTFNDLAGVTALRLEALPDERLPARGPGRTYYEGPFGDFTLCEFTVAVNGQRIKVKRATHSFASGGFTADKAIDGDPQTGWSIAGGQGRAHYAVFEFAEPLPAGAAAVTMLFERHFSAGLGRFRLSTTTSARPPAARDLSDELEALLVLPDDQLTPDQRAQLRRQFALTTPLLAKQRQAIEELRQQMPARPTTLVMQERPPENPRPTFVHHRGEFLQPGERVEPGVLSILPGEVPRHRLEFARWLVTPSHPLTARVTVNRHWAAFFGTGLVPSVQDFGLTGEAPSHPELLDWLATEFIRQGWSVKRLHEIIVTSATYRMRSSNGAGRGELPASSRLSPMPRVRLEAEAVRDSVLQSAGLLSSKMGGPSVFPPQPANVTTEGAYGQLAWKVSSGEDRYRRGLYTFMKRTAPFAMGTTFDGPSGEVCLPRREVSNTPLQALTMLNDVALLEAAQTLGREFAAKSGSLPERLTLLFRRCLTRPPDAAESAMLVRFFERQRDRFQSLPAEAEKLAGDGSDSIDRAAWTAVARALFNLDEMIVRD